MSRDEATLLAGTGGRPRAMAQALANPSLAVRAVWRRLPLGRFHTRCDYDAYPRPAYAYGIQQASVLAHRLGLPAISVIELGVAGGTGLLALEQLAADATRAVGVHVEAHGFDGGVGLPAPRDPQRDLAYNYPKGAFEMDQAALRSRLRTSHLHLGSLADTIAAFIAAEEPPIGFIAFDLDYFSSSVQALALCDAPPPRLLPRVWCYLDDVIGRDQALHCDWVGELAAVRHYNDAREHRKMALIHGLSHKRVWPAPWNDSMFALHCFDHPDYSTYIGPETRRQLTLAGT